MSDEFYVELEKRAAMEAMSMEHWVGMQLERVKEHRVSDRILIVGRDAREVLERQLGGGMLKSDEDLVAKVERLAVLEIGTLKTNFSPGQWEELARYCARRGVSVESEAQRIVAKISELFFDHVGAT